MEPKLLLLGLLRQQDMHGYQLYEFIDRDLSVCTDLKKSTAYYLLSKMEADGWIAEEQVQEGNRPPRKVYSLTKKGETEYQRLLRSNLKSHTPAFFPGDAGLAFMDTLERKDALALLKERRQALTASLADMQEVPPHHGGVQLVIEHRQHHMQSELDWLDALIEHLEQSPAILGATANS